jgi:hypothetical protein
MAYKYSQLNDLENYIDYRLLVQLTSDSQLADPDNPGNINSIILQACENAAADLIDNKLRYYYQMPLVGIIPSCIKQINSILTLKILYERRSLVPTYVQKLFDAQILRLEDMRSDKPKERLVNVPLVAKPDGQGM